MQVLPLNGLHEIMCVGGKHQETRTPQEPSPPARVLRLQCHSGGSEPLWPFLFLIKAQQVVSPPSTLFSRDLCVATP